MRTTLQTLRRIGVSLCTGALFFTASLHVSAKPAHVTFGVHPEIIYQKSEHRLWLATRLYADCQPQEDTPFSSLRILPFSEFTCTTTRDSIGKMEAGVQFLYEALDWLDVSLLAQYVTTPRSNLHDELVSHHFREDHGLETAIQVSAGHDLPCTLFGRTLAFTGSETYVYDVRFGRDVRNEVAVNTLVRITPRLDAGIMWRHIDLVHAHDTDEFVANATITF